MVLEPAPKRQYATPDQCICIILEHTAFVRVDLFLAIAGLTNEYLINIGAPAALRYNDHSVNENTHAALGFELLQRQHNNFLEV